MANTITISISDQDLASLKEDSSLSPSKLFRSAMKLHRSMTEFLDIYDIIDYKLILSDREFKILQFQKEIERRQERIDSLADVLAQKELALRRI